MAVIMAVPAALVFGVVIETLWQGDLNSLIIAGLRFDETVTLVPNSIVFAGATICSFAIFVFLLRSP